MMNINIHSQSYALAQNTNELLKRMLSPVCGLVKEIGFVRRSSREPKIIATGGDLTGVHVLMNKPDPGRGAYHLGADGVHFNEAIIKTLGESVERYSQLLAEISNRFSTVFLPYSQMVKLHGDSVLPIDQLSLFNEEQYVRSGFPFEGYADQPLTWVKLPSLLSYRYLWVPAQFIFVGYQIKRKFSEPWLSAAVTTGTAAHTDKYKALINSILELIQIDSAMGHWYSSRSAPRIILDKRTLPLEKVLLRQGNFNHANMSFHLLENPDLPGLSVACVYRNAKKGFPAVAVGLGSDTRLIRAMYKAYLEMIGIMGLARMVIFQNKGTTKPKDFYDLDTNVGYYAKGNQFDLIQEKFPLSETIYAAQAPKDIDGSSADQIQTLVNGFKQSNKELLFCDLSCTEASDLGFYVPRVWSPDTLSLCLPSAPWLTHPRFFTYGGVHHEQPHPYP